MKRVFCSLLLMLMVLCANAVPAKRGISKEITLIDGTTVTATLVGDEHGHYWLANGQAYRAMEGSDIYQPINLQEAVQKAREKRSAANAQHIKRLNRKRVGEFGDYKGQKKGLIILVNFSDVSFNTANDNALFKRIANEKNFSYDAFKGSMYDYFYAQSGGQFELTFDVVGPVKVSKKQTYYGANDNNGDDKYPATMVIEALKLADPSVNFADYDWDGDKVVDQVYIVYAGQGEADGGAESTIWPHAYTLTEAKQYGDGAGPQTLDGVKIDTYACGAELDGTKNISGIGTMCHEFSHCLGYPDFYDTDYSGGQGMGQWDLMDSGSYNDDGFQPAGYTSYERWVAGWSEPIELTSSLTVTGMKGLQEGGESYVIYNPGNRDEYFLLENRRNVGWDASLPGEGLLIIHVDYDATAWARNTPNDTPSHQRMTWIPADNKYQYETYDGDKYYTAEGMANDPYPYGSNNSFSKNSAPAAKLYNKNTDGSYYLNTSVENIAKSSNGTISFTYRGLSNVATPVFSLKAGRYNDPQTVSISCATSGATIHYTLDGSTPTASSTVYSAPLTISETTMVKAIAILNDEESALAVAKYTIGAGSSDPNTKTFKLVKSIDELEDGMRYIIASAYYKVAAGDISNSYLKPVSVIVNNDVITISDDVAVFFVEGNQTDGWTFMNEKTNEYLYSPMAKSMAYGSSASAWEMNDGTNGVTMSSSSSGLLQYNSNSPRFSTYGSSQREANLFMEYSGGGSSTETVAAPAISGTTPFVGSTLVTISAETGASVYYTLDGTTPSLTSTLYTAPFTLTATTTLKAIAIKNDTRSDVTTKVFVLSGGDQPTGDSDIFELIMDAGKLASGNKILITFVDENSSIALGTNQKTNNREAVSVTKNADGTLTPGSDAQVITLEQEGTMFLFNVGNGYLYAASATKNWLKTEPTADDNAKATIQIEFGFATITFQGSYTRNVLRYNPNNGSPLFSCYEATSKTGTLPQIYRMKSGSETSVMDLRNDIIMHDSGLYFDLSGRSYTERPTQRGIYIHNGQKFIVK